MRVLPILAIILILGAAVSAHLGVADSKSGVVHVAEALLRGDLQCNMPGDGTAWRVSENANSVQFVIHYRFMNQRSANQRFVVGYKVWKQSGNSWIVVADNERAVDRNVSANDSASGDCNVPRLSLAGGGNAFRVMVTYGIAGGSNGQTSRTFRIERAL